MTSLVLPLLFLIFSPLELELAGNLPEAGAAWQEKSDIAGQVRITGRLIEEAIYAGHSERAMMLVEELQSVCPDPALAEFWKARTAWSCGLAIEAIEELETMETSDTWLYYRARGLAALYRGNGDEAVNYLLLATAAGTSARRQYWSALDLCSAYLNIGQYNEAITLSELLVNRFTGDALAVVMYGLCLHAHGRYGESSRVLSQVEGMGSYAAETMAAELLEGFEQ